MANQALIDEYIAMGGSEDVAALSDDDLTAKLEALYWSKQPQPTFIQDLWNGNTKAADEATSQMAIGAGIQPYEITPAKKSIGTMTDEELQQMLVSPDAMKDFVATGAVEEGALGEQQMRDLTDSRTFIENLADPKTAGWTSSRLAKQAGASTLNTLDLPAQGAGMYGLAAMGVEKLIDTLNGEDAAPKIGSTQALDYANERYRASLEALDVSEPRNIPESLAGIAGMMIPLPGGKMNAGLDALEYMTPFVIGGNKAPRLAVNFATAAVMDQSIRELTDEKGDQYQTAFDLMNVGDVDGYETLQLGSLAAAPTLAMFGGPAASRVFIANRVPTPTIAALRDLDRLGPDNLYSITKNSDVLKGYTLSDTDAIVEIARRAGVPNIDELQKQFDTTTQTAASSRVTEALSTGNMPTIHGTFTAPVAPRQLAAVMDLLSPQQQIDVNNYMLLGNYSDVIRRRLAQDADAWAAYQHALKSDPNAPKPTQISKATDRKELGDIATMRDALRTSVPMLSEFSKGFQQLTEEARRFISTGPYALIDSKTRAMFDKDQPHYVPIKQTSVDPADDLLKRIVDAGKTQDKDSDLLGWLEQRDIGAMTMQTLGMQEGALKSIVGYTQNLLHAQLKNNAKGAYVDAMLNSNYNQAGKPLIRKATTKEMQDMKQAGRLVEVTRNGKKEAYITESYIAKTLKLDPYVLTNPIAMGFFATRRMMEHGTTGAASITFPLTSMIRDTLSGWANTSKGSKAPGWGVITAPAEILGAKAMKAFYTAIEDRLAAGTEMFIPGMDAQSQKQLAARIANTYQNTFYHLAQSHGGYDASIMKERIRLAQGQMGEVIKSIPQPISKAYNVSVGPLLNGISAVMDALLEAPRYNAAKRAVVAGGDVEEALLDARKMTGDTSKSGRAYDRKGNLITGDVVNPRSSIANPLIGGLVEAARIAVPYTNPTIKGMQRAAQMAMSDPVRFAARNWLAVGLPAVAGYAWNSMLSQDNENGYDYLDYQFNQRASNDQVMEMYFGVPGLPPERGISIPIAHESTPFMSPFTTFLFHMGSSGEDMQRAMTQVGLGILDNTFSLSMPPAISAGLNLAGVSGMDNLVGSNSPYQTREDNVGVLPQNIENAMRAQFGTMSGIGLEAMSAFMDDGDVTDGLDELMNSLAKRLPVVKGLGGWRTNSAYFTPIAAEQRLKLDAFNAFDDAWTTHFQQEGLVTSPKLPVPGEFPDVEAGGENMLEFPRAGVGPQPTMKPINPLYELYGQQIHDSLMKKDPYNFPITRAQMGALTDQVRLLRGFNSGRADDFKALQDMLNASPAQVGQAQEAFDAATTEYDDMPRGTKTTTPEGIAAKAAVDAAKEELFRYKEYANTAKFLKDEHVDLSNRFDVIRLTNLMEQRRVDLMKYQLSIIEQVENDLTAQLQSQGLMSPDDHFAFEKHLSPMVNPVLEEVQRPPVPPSATAQKVTE